MQLGVVTTLELVGILSAAEFLKTFNVVWLTLVTAVVLAKITADCFNFCSLPFTGLIFFIVFLAAIDVGSFLPGVFV